ncbi:hypothetical protein PV749_36320 [Streptomyces sp. ID03-2B]|uniref:hypothetical protein n=1 Tax=Streptomyces sp. ID03-2B TaxID=3028660 RepID=UPI0029B08B7F|nr:hypothetical protein [Streptomyces sp. ID03-2B]MDX3596601.1 hypothetical protein [Streptomyces sp. ID03-2B]
MTTTMTTAPTAPAPTTAPAPVPPPAPAPAPAPAPVPPPVPGAASRRSVHVLAAAVGGLAVAGLLYVLVDRPGLREPLEAAAQIIGAATTAAGVVWGVVRASR